MTPPRYVEQPRHPRLESFFVVLFVLAIAVCALALFLTTFFSDSWQKKEAFEAEQDEAGMRTFYYNATGKPPVTPAP